MEDYKLFYFIKNYWYLSLILSNVYIFSIHKFKSNRKYNLNKILPIWNLMLTLYSGYSLYKMTPLIYNNPSICYNDDNRLKLWGSLYGLSKVFELLDTLFILLSQKKLIFLHWYHHSIVLVYTWYSISSESSTGKWFIYINLIIHTIMYFYYFLTSLKINNNLINIIKKNSKYITLLQILQMFIGMFVNMYALLIKDCKVTNTNIFISLTMYFSFCYLFIKFMYKRNYSS